MPEIFANKEAENMLEEILLNNPNDAKALMLLATLKYKNSQFKSAKRLFEKVLELDSNAYAANKSLADINYLIDNKPEETIKYYTNFLKYEPQNVEAMACLSLAYLKIKDYKNGWAFFEKRPPKQKAIDTISSLPESKINAKPLWQGEDIKDKTLYVYYEAGYGDVIMFARYLPLLKNKCKKVLFRPQASLTNLFEDCNLGVEVLSQDIAECDTEYDYHIPVMSLPYLLGLNSEECIPYPDKYLKANYEKVQNYKEIYFNNSQFKVGINWHGNTEFTRDRCYESKSLAPLLMNTNAKIYSLQKGDGIEQLEQLIEFDIVDLGSTFNDFSDTAAAIENLDLVITNDTSIAHLSGALGKQCWIALPYVQDWRWSTDLSYCPWYKSAKLFKQKQAGNWDEVFNRVYKEFKKML